MCFSYDQHLKSGRVPYDVLLSQCDTMALHVKPVLFEPIAGYRFIRTSCVLCLRDFLCTVYFKDGAAELALHLAECLPRINGAKRFCA